MHKRSLSGRIFTGLRLPAGLLIGVLAVYFAARELDLAALPEALKMVSASWLALALLVSFSGHVFKAMRWQILLGSEGSAIPFRAILQFILAGQFTNLFVPGRAGDIGRAVVVGNRGVGKIFALSTVVVEKVLDLVLYAFLTAVLVVQAPLPVEIDLTPQSLLAVSGIALLGLFVAVRYWDVLGRFALRLLLFLPEKRLLKVRTWVHSAGKSLAAFRKSGRIAALLAWSILFWIAGWLTNEFVLRSFGLQLPFTASLLLLVVLQAGISTNLVPGTIGVFEYLCVISLSLFSVPRQTALAYGVVLHIIVLTPLVFGTASALFSGRNAAVRTDP